MRSDRFAYELPPGRIARHPVEPRDAARLLVAIGGNETRHRQVRDLVELVRPADLLVLNRTAVIPARLVGRKATGGAVEVLLVRPTDDPHCWEVLIKGRVRQGTQLTVAGLPCTVSRCGAAAERVLRFPAGTDVLALAENHGAVPLPPYIDRPAEAYDRERYQTVFADSPGSVAAPTAALHFTRGLLERLRERGVAIALVDLAIGPGTFRPVTSERVEDHRLHRESCRCPAETVAAVEACRRNGGRVIAIGTTVVRTLETAWRQPGGFAPWEGPTGLFLHPPDRIGSIDLLLTNFHLPRSSLLMLVACLTGIDRVLALYREAIDAGYRFYSYGDAMLVDNRPPGNGGDAG